MTSFVKPEIEKERRKQLHFMVSRSDTVAKVRQLFMPKRREKKKRDEEG